MLRDRAQSHPSEVGSQTSISCGLGYQSMRPVIEPTLELPKDGDQVNVIRDMLAVLVKVGSTTQPFAPS